MMKRLPIIALALSASLPGTLAEAATAEKDDKPVMLKQPASTEPLVPVNPSRFGEKPADEAFGAYQRGLYLTALNLALPRAEKGDPAAQVLAAEIYSRGLGVPVNPVEAARWYEKAADQGVTEAQFRYGAMLLSGKDIPRDKARAEKLMKAAAEAGNPMAQFNYGQLMMMNHPGETGLDMAFPWFMKAAEARLADGEYALSQLYANGTLKIPRDDKKAREYLERAAKQGYDTAQLDLATWYIEGRGGPRNYENGFRWMHRAAITGNVAAQARLARLYRDGIGTEGNSIEAAAWYIVARRAGLSARDLDSFMDGLDENQIKEAIARAGKLR
jgi:uncharacterized protein